MQTNLALYRRYRPETFAEVIGQDHVTGPLRHALAANRVNHAYLFSGPRGCGKTTSARILARALNCERAPVAEPCGECRSCRDLTRNGPGSIDVIEIDAASHGGVDDARDLRERAFFAPVNSRYKVYIIDEAHMVTTQGFNALLKLVEEPPEHLKFIFATTEPEKVIPTIRSRTHHYPFRLIPPRLLSDYLAQVCRAEGVPIEPSALPLVVRAGAGSARDSLSILDQLLGGAGEAGVTYDVATGLLGYTPDNLLDEVVDAFAAGDGAGVFGVVDRVIETGQDPRRFTEDLLRRLRDLVIVAAVPDASTTGLLDVPEDQAERLEAQAARFGRAELVRAADTLADGLTEMRGATTPRLLLELICARVLLPGADHDTLGLTARMDRLERRLDMGAPPAGTGPSTSSPPAAEQPRPAVAAAAHEQQHQQQHQRPEHEHQPPQRRAQGPEGPPQPADPPPAQRPGVQERSQPPHSQPAPGGPSGQPTRPQPAAAQHSQEPTPGRAGLGLADVRRIWPDLLDRVKSMRRFTWILLSQNAQVLGLDDGVLTVGFKSAGARDSFSSGGSEEILRQALIDQVGVDWRVESVVDPAADPGSETSPRVTRPATGSVPTRAEPPIDSPPDLQPDSPPDPGPGPRPDSGPESRPGSEPGGRLRSAAAEHARRQLDPGQAAPGGGSAGRASDADAHPDDPDADALSGEALLQREFGATVVEEFQHDSR